MCEFDGELRDLGTIPDELLVPLDRKLAEDPGIWLREDLHKPNRFEAFRGSTLHVVLQFPEDLRSHQRSRYSGLWEDWAGVVEPLVEQATRGYGYRRGRTARILLAKLLRGKEVGRHVDGSPSAEVPHKIHVPVVTDPAVRFLVGEGEYTLERGRAYEVNNRRRHAVVNDSEVDRVHLIFDWFDAS